MRGARQISLDPAQEVVSRFVHRLAQPLATAALALEIAQIAGQRGDAREAGNRVEAALQALRLAQSILLERSIPALTDRPGASELLNRD